MTIDITTFREDDALIQPHYRTFYPSKIPQQHYQLKNFISAVDRESIYYVSKNQIYALHTTTRKRELIATLSFLPQCLGAGFGWICVGGPVQGRCAFLTLEDSFSSNALRQSTARHTAEVDALLPLDLDPHSRILTQSSLESHEEHSGIARHHSKIEYRDLGGDIVNSIAVHRLRSGKEGIHDEIVAAIANNDKTIRIFSLSQSRVLQTLDFPTCMNHATISPDGNLLVACGDEPRAFFCRRRRLASLAVNGDSVFARYEWHEIADPRLTVATPHDMCFATAFSPSGHICAVASQTGTITIFDTKLIKDNLEADEAVLDAFKSSRAARDYEDMPGAVRSMAFGPGPWDLLAWAEDRGRVCVTDLRNNFQSRQTIELDINAVDTNRVEVSNAEDEYSTAEQRELEIEARFVQRHREALDAQDHLAAVNHAADYMELAAERRRLQRELREAGLSNSLDDEPHGLTAGERQILDSLRVERQRFSDRSSEPRDANDHPFSVHYLQPSRIRNLGSPSTPSSSTPYNATIRQHMRERNLERNIERARPPELRSYQPRRRSSVVISNNNTSNTSNSSSSRHPPSLAPIGTNTATLSTSPSRLATTNTDSTRPNSLNAPPSPIPIPATITDPWQTISAAMAYTSSSTPSLGNPARLRLDREHDIDNIRLQERIREREREATESSVSNFERRIQATARLERLRSTRLRQLQERGEDSGYEDYELEMLRRLAGGRRRGEAGNELVTMGIGWSPDGRYL
ncbi:hypothetical protein MMC13_007243 [Lambiella insularis]|nr:hypothetical protein [Lambiella insularis]